MRKLEKVVKGLQHCFDTKCEGCPYLKKTSCLDQLKNDALELLKARQWISVKDRLPVKTGEYIVCGIDEDGDYFVTSDQWFDTVRHWYLFDEHTDSVVTHWLVLPKPPMKGE